MPSAQNQIQIVDTHETSETLTVTRLQRVGYQINRTLLNPQPMEETFKNEFLGMTSEPIKLDDLLNTQQRLMAELPQALTQNHRNFLLSLVQAAPDWSLMPFNHLQDMPAIKWKLQNLNNLKSKNPTKFRLQHEELEQLFKQQ